jgi:hypothetical protein
MANFIMSPRSSQLRFASGLWWWMVVLLLAVRLLRMERLGGGVSHASSQNRLEFDGNSDLARRDGSATSFLSDGW